MEKEITSWNRHEDDKYHLLKDVWKETPLAVKRKFLFDFIDSNFRLYDEPCRNINPFKPCGNCEETEPTDRCIGCQFVQEIKEL